MADPRLTKSSAPRGRDPTIPEPDPLITDPVERDRTGGAMWGWIAGIAVLILIAFIIVGGWGWSNGGRNTAVNSPAAPATTGVAPASTGTAAPNTGAAPARR